MLEVVGQWILGMEDIRRHTVMGKVVVFNAPLLVMDHQVTLDIHRLQGRARNLGVHPPVLANRVGEIEIRRRYGPALTDRLLDLLARCFHLVRQIPAGSYGLR